MANKNPTYKLPRGNKAYALRKTHGRPKASPIPSLQANQTFRHIFRTYIREKNHAWFEEELPEDTKFDRIIKKAGRDLTAESTTVQAIISTFNYLEPIPKSELDGTSNEVLPAEQKELIEKISMLNLEGLRKIAAILEEEKYITTDEHV